MKISEIYKNYKITSNLQQHLFRVSAVAWVICDNFRKPVDKDLIVSACLLHDIGNIVKFDLKAFPEGLKPQGYEYWEKVKNEFIHKYGKDDHKATYKMIKEIGVNKKVSQLVKSFGFSKSKETFKSPDFEEKIAVYSDMRVLPYGIDSLSERMLDVKDRYVLKGAKYSEKEFEYLTSVWNKIEEQVFFHCNIGPEDITERKIFPVILKLKDFAIK